MGLVLALIALSAVVVSASISDQATTESIPYPVLQLLIDYLPGDVVVLARFAGLSRECHELVRDRFRHEIEALIVAPLFEPLITDAEFERTLSTMVAIASQKQDLAAVVVPALCGPKAVYLAERLLHLPPSVDPSLLGEVVQVLVRDCEWRQLAAYLIGGHLKTLNPNPRSLFQHFVDLLQDLLRPPCESSSTLVRLPLNVRRILVTIVLAPSMPAQFRKPLEMVPESLWPIAVDEIRNLICRTHFELLRGNPDLVSALYQLGIVFDIGDLFAADLTVCEFRSVAPLCAPNVPTLRLARLIDRGRPDLITELFRHRVWVWKCVTHTDPLVFFLLCHAAIKFGLPQVLEAVLGIPPIADKLRKHLWRLRLFHMWWPQNLQELRCRPLLILLRGRYDQLRRDHPALDITDLSCVLHEVVLDHAALAEALDHDRIQLPYL